ncbi:low choriolytic enzyme-like [Leuresthes tenuis]|uniref:low choriolytic enzyme-like n=1 Tax=Leuresthes tenuis TaxID=355514 RepID=UPI003B510EAA
MSPAFLFLLILSVMDVSLSALTVYEDQSDESMDLSEIIPRPKIDKRTPMLEGDIAIPDTLNRNADQCTARGCKWPKTGCYVYVPYYISTDYTSKERDIIIRGLQSFSQFTCIRLIPWSSNHRDYLYFSSKSGCWSYVGRQAGGQYISLEKNGCLYHSTVQHEVLHALGFNHEQVRSDRDKYVRILTENIEEGKAFAFEKKPTNNLKTPYDFNSVMQYHKYAFSKNGKPTIVAKCDPNLNFGHAKKMSKNDILRVNRLYKCY